MFTAREHSAAGEAANFCAKRTALDAKVVRELLSVERDVELELAALLGKRPQIRDEPLLRRAMREDFDFLVQFQSLGGKYAHDIANEARMKCAGVAACSADALGVENENPALRIRLHAQTHRFRAGKRLRSGDEFLFTNALDDGALAVQAILQDHKRAGEDYAEALGMAALYENRRALVARNDMRIEALQHPVRLVQVHAVEKFAALYAIQYFLHGAYYNKFFGLLPFQQTRKQIFDKICGVKGKSGKEGL